MTSIAPGVIVHDRTVVSPQELDICVPSKRLAFEYDGLFWHSAANEKSFKQKLAKTEACEKAGI